MTAPNAQERWTQRVLGGLGARPIGPPAPRDGEAAEDDQEPAEPAAPAPKPYIPPQPTDRLPHWWRHDRPHLGAPVGPGDDAVKTDVTKTGSDVEEDDGDDVAAARMKTRQRPAGLKGNGRQPRKLPVHKAKDTADDPRMRIIAFNGTAAGFGYSLGLPGLVSPYLVGAEQAPTGTFGAALAIGGAYVTARISGAPAVELILPHAPVSRVLMSLAAALLCYRFAPLPVEFLSAHGEEWGLGPGPVSLLITAGGLCGGLWWLIDGPLRATRWHWAVRWMFRVPLASALLACALHVSDPVI